MVGIYDVKTLEEFNDVWYDKAKEAGYPESKEQWIWERGKAQRDLFFLAKSLGYDLVDNFGCPLHPWHTYPEADHDCPDCGQAVVAYPSLKNIGSPHREICDFFVQKEPTKSIAAQDTVKNRLLMVPRGSFKTSIDEADCVQWIICFRDVRIAISPAAEDLGLVMVKKIRDHFVAQEAPDGKKIFTKFHQWFPEHAISSKKKEAEDRFESPARLIPYPGPDGKIVAPRNPKEPTLHAISLKKHTSGWHYDVGKNDDSVSNANSGPSSTSESRKTVWDHMRLARSLIEPYGYHDYPGTPYHEDDAYLYLQEQVSPLKVLNHPAWELKDAARSKPEDELVESDYNLYFPFDSTGTPRLTYIFLKGESSDPKNFSCQYLCNPALSKVVKFSEQMIRSHMVGAESLPQAPVLSIASWDFAYSTERGRDFSVGTVGWFDSIRRIFVRDIIRGRFSKSDLARHVAKQAATWRVDKVVIENSEGANFLETDIRACLVEYGYPECPLEFFPVDSSKGAKEARAESIEIVLVNDELYFSSDIGIMSQVIKEFLNFKPHSKRKDDIVDSIANLVRYRPSASEIPQTEADRQQKTWDILKQKCLQEMLFPGVQEKPVPVPVMPTEWDGMPVICGGCGLYPCACS